MEENTGVRDRAYQEMMKLFEEATFPQRMKRMLSGLGKSKDSGEYKFAKLQLQRLSAPFLAVVVPVVLLAGALAIQTQVEVAAVSVPVEIVEADNIDPLDVEPPPPQDFTPVEFEMVDYQIFDTTTLNVVNPVEVSAAPSAAPTPNAIPQIKSTIMMRNIQAGPGRMASRGTSGRARAIQEFGGSAETETAVLNALRWFATKQNPNGSWGTGHPTAMTGVTLLCFLARGETPSSQEFGEVVRKGLMFLVDSIRPDGFLVGGNDYSHAIGTYALAEAYSMTRMPVLKEAVERTLVPIIEGQHPNGGWDYGLKQSDRDDTSVMGWCAQAIAAGVLALGEDGLPGLKKAYNMVAPGMRVNFGRAADGSGGFGYTGPSPTHGLTSAGVLAMQLTGQARAPEVRAGLNTIDTWNVGWENTNFGKEGGAGQYYFYYATQAVFHDGGGRWTRWNNRMKPAYTRSQTIIPAAESGYVDHLGQARDIGFWRVEQENGGSLHVESGGIFDTAVMALQLTVYYRYLPTHQPVVPVEHAEVLVNEDDLIINIRF